VGRQRIRVDKVDASGEYLVGDVVTLEDASPPPPGTAEEGARALAAFHGYRARLSELDSELPRDPTALSYRLAAVCLMPLRERQSLLEAETARERLILLRHALCEELRVMTAVPSLPATEVARTGWSPN
jgi:Lon protease-like protein